MCSNKTYTTASVGMEEKMVENIHLDAICECHCHGRNLGDSLALTKGHPSQRSQIVFAHWPLPLINGLWSCYLTFSPATEPSPEIR